MTSDREATERELEKLVKALDGRGVVRVAARDRDASNLALDEIGSVAWVGEILAKKRVRAFWIKVASFVLKEAKGKRASKVDDQLVAVFVAAAIERNASVLDRARVVLMKAPGLDVAISVTAHGLAGCKRWRESVLLFDVAVERGDADGDTLDRAFEALAGAPPRDRPSAARMAAWVKAAGRRAKTRPRLAAAMKVCATTMDATTAVLFSNTGSPPAKAVEPVRAFGKGATRGVALVERCIEVLSTGPRRSRARPAKSAQLARATLRPKLPFPPTLLRFLAYDAAFSTLHLERRGFLVLDGLGTDPTKTLRRAIDAEGVLDNVIKAFGRPKKMFPSREELLATLKRGLTRPLYRLPHLGEQQHYLYAGDANDDGELPILGAELEAGLDDDTKTLEVAEVAVWIKYPSFDSFLADQLGIIEDPSEQRDFVALCRQHLKRNRELGRLSS